MGFKMPIEIEVYITLYLYMSKLVDLGTVYLTKFLGYLQINIPRHSRGFFICGQSPMLLAAPVGTTEVLSLATGIVTIYSPYFYPTLFYLLPLTSLSSHVFLVFSFRDRGYVFLIA